ncbi:MAG TPA: type II toxin-antitoxin system PemK/MazF family toxin [Caulobacteraceae bacterium]
MAELPEPRPGLVISYCYLWRDQARLGGDEGVKDRPCVVVLAVQQRQGQRIVTVAPITHAHPRLSGDAVELPKATKDRLGLDDARSWIVVTEVNQFVWPGPDLRPAAPGRWTHGFIPGELLRVVRARMAEHRELSLVRRSNR